MAKASSVEEVKQFTHFQSLRKTLLAENFADRLERPLVYWALPSDRRLPVAFLGRSLRELLNTSFEQLAAAPGIGRKKIGSMLKLLHRAAKAPPSQDGAGEIDRTGEIKPLAERAGARAQFDAAAVSEAMWDGWRETVRRHNLGHEPLGRLAPSLQELPTVIWHSPLSTFLDYSLAELRELKTYGEKRVRVVLEVFHAVHEAVGRARLKSHLVVRLVPRFVAPLESWIADCIQNPHKVTVDSVHECLAVPLVAQVQIDCTSTVSRLVEGRLGIHSAPQNVRMQSKRMGVTRARVYQLLEECQQALQVRWPVGKCLLAVLLNCRESQSANAEGFEALQSVSDLVFPDAAPRAPRDKGTKSLD
jgi:hypothetical protein